MKKVVLLIISILLVGCTSVKKDQVKPIEIKVPDQIIEEPVEVYVDSNDTDIGLYIQNNNTFTLQHEYKANINDGEDIVVFAIFPSNEEKLVMNYRYGTDFYNKWISIPNHDNLKIGFNIKFTINTGEEISYNILDPDTCIQYRKEYILAYLYDDYANRNTNWYSHIEQHQYNDDSLFTALKLYANDAEDTITSKITLTIFTYDGLDDFDENDQYRGNSSYMVTICDINKTC